MKRNLEPPTLYERELCKKFSEECFKTNLDEYSRRNQEVQEKIKKDIYNGKIAELMVHRYLIYHKKPCTAPDFVIYPPKHKSFDADLVSGDIHIHVKSCLQSKKMGE